MSAGLVVVLAALVWLVLAALIGPKEKVRLEQTPDPY